MATQISKAALKQLEKTSYLASSMRTQKPIVNARLADLKLELLAGETADPASVPDWDHLQEWGISKLEASALDVRQVDRTHRHKLVHLDKRRDDRVTFVDEVNEDYRQLRQSFSGTYGDNALALVGLDAVLARSFLAISEQVSELIVRMRDPGMAAALPEPTAGQSPIDLEVLATAWEARTEKLDQMSAEIDTLINNAQESRVLVQETLQRSQRLYVNVGRLQEGLYRLAGLGELADRMRATVRAPRKKVDDEAGDSPPAESEEGSLSAAPDEGSEAST